MLTQKALRRRWIVHRDEPTPRGGNVLTYFARYARGGPLKEARLEAFDGENVTFLENRRGEPRKALTWPVDFFLERLLRHVPPHNYRTLRSCGLYAPNAAEKRQKARSALGQAPIDEASTKETDDAGDLDCCEVCGKKLVLIAKIPRPKPRAPPKRKTKPTRRNKP